MGMVVFPVLVNRHSGNDRIKHHKGQSMVQPCWLGLACAVVAVTGGYNVGVDRRGVSEAAERRWADVWSANAPGGG